jgi:arylsulfatase
VGQVLATLRDSGLDENTLVMFSSDNGPWFQGTAGGLRGRKGSTYEGGFRIPFIARYPARIPAAQVSNVFATTMDILPTIARLTGAPLPSKPLDGVDITPYLSGSQADTGRDVFLYFNDWDLQCARLGRWKLHLARYNVPLYTPLPARGRANLPLPRAELYDMINDPAEAYDRSEANLPAVAEIRAQVDRLIATFPDPVPEIYRQTKVRPVLDTPSGSLPQEPA